MSTSPGYRLGLDIGGTKIAAGLVDSAGRVHRRWRIPTPPAGGGQVVEAIISMITVGLAAHPLMAVGVGSPGVIDPTSGEVLSATAIVPRWAGIQLRHRLMAATHLPVVVDNDVRALAIGEARYGAGRGHHRLLVASVGTGVGGALIHGGNPEHGPHRTAGEIAHLLAPDNGAIPCGCGRRDHLEAHASGPAIEAAYARRTGEEVDLVDLVGRWRSGDRGAGAVITGAAQVLGRALAGLASAVDVQAVVIGGGVTQIGDDYLDAVREAFRSSVIAPMREVAVLAAALGTDAPLIGAAALAEGHLPVRAAVPSTP